MFIAHTGLDALMLMPSMPSMSMPHLGSAKRNFTNGKLCTQSQNDRLARWAAQGPTQGFPDSPPLPVKYKLQDRSYNSEKFVFRAAHSPVVSYSQSILSNLP